MNMKRLLADARVSYIPSVINILLSVHPPQIRNKQKRKAETICMQLENKSTQTNGKKPPKKNRFFGRQHFIQKLSDNHLKHEQY